MQQRHRARRLAMQALCCMDVQGERAMELVQQVIVESKESGRTTAIAQEMLRGAIAFRDESDRMLVRHARHWNLERLALVDRNIMRLAVYEMLSGSTPPKVVISESLRLAHEFSTAESPRFVNGILDAVYREMRADVGSQEHQTHPRKARGTGEHKDQVDG